MKFPVQICVQATYVSDTAQYPVAQFCLRKANYMSCVPSKIGSRVLSQITIATGDDSILPAKARLYDRVLAIESSKRK